jgi:hypothetical protein
VVERTLALHHYPQHYSTNGYIFIALNILYYLGANKKYSKKKIWSIMCKKAHCLFQKSIIKAAGQILAEHKREASPSPSTPPPPPIRALLTKVPVWPE